MLGMDKLNELKKFAEYFSINWLDGLWTVFIEKVNGQRVDADSGVPHLSLDTAIQAAIDEAKFKMNPSDFDDGSRFHS